eukprot:3566296-Rhodomonas_salina.1
MKPQRAFRKTNQGLPLQAAPHRTERRMLEGVLAQVVESAVGKYVDGIDKKAAKLSVWSGKIALKDLKLKTSVSPTLHRAGLCTPNG